MCVYIRFSFLEISIVLDLQYVSNFIPLLKFNVITGYF